MAGFLVYWTYKVTVNYQSLQRVSTMPQSTLDKWLLGGEDSNHSAVKPGKSSVR